MSLSSLFLKIPLVAVRVIIENDEGAVLVLKRANTKFGNGLWCLPGGMLEFGHTLKQTAIEEVKEETNLTIENLKFLFFLETLPTLKMKLHFITFYFYCQNDGTPILNEESSDFRWLHWNQLQDFQFAFLNDFALKYFWMNK